MPNFFEFLGVESLDKAYLPYCRKIMTPWTFLFNSWWKTYLFTRNHLFHIIPRNRAWTTTFPFSEVFWSLLSKDIFLKAQRYTLGCALIPLPEHDICFIVFCWFQNIWFGFFEAAQHRQLQLHHSTTAASIFTTLN